MEIQNNLENKAKFSCLYHGQRLQRIKESYGVNATLFLVSANVTENSFLELKHLSRISDYEAINVAKIVCPEMFQNAGVDPIKIERHGEWLTVWRKRNVHSVDIDFLGYTTCQNEEVEYKRNSIGTTFAIDFLRSRGYALPWMGISVETLIEWGWVKLKGGEND